MFTHKQVRYVVSITEYSIVLKVKLLLSVIVIHGFFFFFSFLSPPHLLFLERPLQLPQASPQRLPIHSPFTGLRPCCPSQLVKEWAVLHSHSFCRTVAPSGHFVHLSWSRSGQSCIPTASAEPSPPQAMLSVAAGQTVCRFVAPSV